MNAKVSVIIPVYNVENFLAECLDSVLAQTFEDIEVICVNDGSTDNSLNILEHYSKFDPRIKIINKKNGGTASARNSGVSFANGCYTVFLDADDRISADMVEVLYKNASKNESDVVIFDYVWKNITSNGYVLSTIKEFKNSYRNRTFSIDTTGSLSYKIIPTASWVKLYRTNFIKNKIKFIEGMKYSDIPFWTEIYTKAKKITYVPEPLYYRNFSPEYLLKKKGREGFDIIEAYNLAECILKKHDYWNKYKASVYALMMRDFLNNFNLISPELKESFFDAIKSLKKDIDYKLYESSDFNKIEQICAKKFEQLNLVDYRTFCTTSFEVNSNG